MNTAFLALFILLQIADIWTTLTALKKGAREANPLLAWLFERLSPLGVMLVLKLLGVYALWYLNWLPLSIGACLVYLWVVWNNWKVMTA